MKQNKKWYPLSEKFIFNIKKILMDVVSEEKEKTFKKNNQN